MRNRTEMVSNTGSDYDENEGEFEADDGSDDWKPDPEVSSLKFSLQFILWMCLWKWRFVNNKIENCTLQCVSLYHFCLASFSRVKFANDSLSSTLTTSRIAKKLRKHLSAKQHLQRLQQKRRRLRKKNPRRNLKILRTKKMKIRSLMESLTKTKKRTSLWTR